MPRLCERFTQPHKQSNSFPASTGQNSCRRAVKIVDIDHSSDPTQREFDVLELAEACQPERNWDYEAAKRWFNRAAVPKYLDARQADLDAYFRARGHDQALTIEQRKSTGRHRAPWYLSIQALNPVGDDAQPGGLTAANPSETGSGTVEPDLTYEFTPPGEIKLSFVGRLLLGQGAFVTLSARGLVWGILMLGPVLFLMLCVYLLWSMRLINRPLLTSDLMLALMLICTCWICWRLLIRPCLWLLEDRIVPAAVVLYALKEDPAQLDMAKDDKHRYLRLVRYGGICPVCAGTIELRYGVGVNSRRLFGCCGEAPQDHVFTFDRVTRTGQRYLV
ncbi:hypothetical protein [Rhodoferax sediminis]|uniref:Uncharacterized protein n=1 Tax=Rhodoferax sediminis TaxID=2509614 RepID=A0A515DFX0_9BURK|nr:hypothetical protein [Rhodoferax sediminis]QDL39315.1 hypothetical protein EUB48_19840 [Rhodoferax sediminis]